MAVREMKNKYNALLEGQTLSATDNPEKIRNIAGRIFNGIGKNTKLGQLLSMLGDVYETIRKRLEKWGRKCGKRKTHKTVQTFGNQNFNCTVCETKRPKSEIFTNCQKCSYKMCKPCFEEQYSLENYLKYPHLTVSHLNDQPSKQVLNNEKWLENRKIELHKDVHELFTVFERTQAGRRRLHYIGFTSGGLLRFIFLLKKVSKKDAEQFQNRGYLAEDDDGNAYNHWYEIQAYLDLTNEKIKLNGVRWLRQLNNASGTDEENSAYENVMRLIMEENILTSNRMTTAN